MPFARVPLSGGLRWKKTENITGDVVCTEPNYIFPFSIEVKFNRDINFEKLLIPKRKLKKRKKDIPIREFWNQTLRDSERGKKIPLLLLRYNGLPRSFFFVIMSYEFAKRIRPRKKPLLKLNNELIITTTIALNKSGWKIYEKTAKNLIKKKWPRNQ
jgi:hypothetical protein